MVWSLVAPLAAALLAALRASSASKNSPIIGILLIPLRSFPVRPTCLFIFSTSIFCSLSWSIYSSL
jgi:hypothetical protein